MPRLAAHRSNVFAGWIRVPEHQGFVWVLRLAVTPRISVTLPIRVHTQDKGWTQYFFAELDGLAPWQVEAMIANNVFDPAQPVGQSGSALQPDDLAVRLRRFESA